ncbi:hypothetical protein, partial [Escherichia coli]
ILLVMMLAMGTHIPQPVIRILAGASTTKCWVCCA